MPDPNPDAKNGPTISILITTFNRKELLKRCLDRVLAQTFTDFEVIVIDDCSQDGTDSLMAAYTDPRIRYVRNSENQGATYGDRVHIKRFVYELSRGKYFVYVCDDDYWISSTLLAEQMSYFKQYPAAVMVTGGQLSCFLHGEDAAPSITDDNLDDYLEYIDYVEYLEKKYGPVERSVMFFKGAFPATFMSSDDFLRYFSTFPITANIIGGATLYNRELFMRSGALQSTEGSKWQAGYELRFGPAAYGDCIYMDKPCIVTEIRQQNASFNRTQLDHYNDSLKSIEIAFANPLKAWEGTAREDFLQRMKANAIEHLGRTYMSNTMVIRRYGGINMCTEDNIGVPVNAWHIFQTRKAGGARFPLTDIKSMILISLPRPLLKGWDLYRRVAPRKGPKFVLPQRYREAIFRHAPAPARRAWGLYRRIKPRGTSLGMLKMQLKRKILLSMPSPMQAWWRQYRLKHPKNTSLQG